MSPGANGIAEREAYLNRYHSEWWENPRDVRSPVFQRLNDLVFERLPPGPGRALDIGAGRGTLTARLRDRGLSVTAIEMSPDFAAQLRARFPCGHAPLAFPPVAAVEWSSRWATSFGHTPCAPPRASGHGGCACCGTTARRGRS